MELEDFILKRVLRNLTLFAGTLRTQPSVPWGSSHVRDNKISLAEASEAVRAARYGDVGLHRSAGYLTNAFIPGAMKHAWLHTHDMQDAEGMNGGYIMEAIGTGVGSKHALTPYMSDYGILLRPRGVSDEQRKGACVKAEEIRGAAYDTNFSFDIDAEMKFYNPINEKDRDEALAALSVSEQALQKWHYAFSCSEAVAYCWWHCRKELRLYRRKFLGKPALLPIDFMHEGFQIVWVSESWTRDIAEKQGLGEEAMDMLTDWYNRG